MAKRDLTLEASADIEIGGLPLTVALSQRPDPDTQLLDVLLEVRLNLTDHPQSISLKKILSALFGSSVGDELGVNIEFHLDKLAIDLYLKQKKIVLVVAIKGETNLKELGVKEKKAKDGKPSSNNQEEKAKFGVLIIKQKAQKAKICFFVQPNDFFEQKSTSLEEEASKWTKICYVKLKKWEEEEEEQEKVQNKKQEKESEKEQNKKQDPTSKQDPASKPSRSGASSSSPVSTSVSTIPELISSITVSSSLIGVFGQCAAVGAVSLTIGGLIVGRPCSTIAEALKHTYNTAHKGNETQPLALPIPDKQILLGLVQHSSGGDELSAYKKFINYYQYYYYQSETQSLSMSDVHKLSTIFIEAYTKNYSKTKLATQALITRSVKPDWIIAELWLSAQELEPVLDTLFNKYDLNQIAVNIKQANEILQERRIPPLKAAHALKAISELKSANIKG